MLTILLLNDWGDARDGKDTTQATVGGSPFGPFISVARGHSRE